MDRIYRDRADIQIGDRLRNGTVTDIRHGTAFDGAPFALITCGRVRWAAYAERIELA